MEPSESDDYIFAHERDRETVTVNRMFADDGGVLADWLGPALKWNLPFVWMGLRIPHKRLLRGYPSPPKKFLGDVDVFGASLQAVSREEYLRYVDGVRRILSERAHPATVEQCVAQDMILEGKTKWPPDLSYIAAAEVKAAYFNARGDLKAAGDKRNGRDQARVLCMMGFDRVALARIVVTEPVDFEGHHPWMVAAARSGEAMDDYLGEPKGISVEQDDAYGTVLISAGAVSGKLEHMAGAMSAEWLGEVPDNPHKVQAAEVRKAVEANLLEVMGRHPTPRGWPVLILACSDDKCGHLYIACGDPSATCPACGGPPR